MSIGPREQARDTAFLRRVIRPRLANLTPGAAKAILALRADPADRERMHELQAKVNDGALSSDDEMEQESYLRVGRFLDLMRAKALIPLKKAGIAIHSETDE